MHSSCSMMRILFLILLTSIGFVRAMENNASTDLLESLAIQKVVHFFNAIHERKVNLVGDC